MIDIRSLRAQLRPQVDSWGNARESIRSSGFASQFSSASRPRLLSLDASCTRTVHSARSHSTGSAGKGICALRFRQAQRNVGPSVIGVGGTSPSCNADITNALGIPPQAQSAQNACQHTVISRAHSGPTEWPSAKGERLLRADHRASVLYSRNSDVFRRRCSHLMPLSYSACFPPNEYPTRRLISRGW